MKIQALRSSYGDNGFVRRGQVIDVPDARAQQLIKRGIFDTPQNIAAAKKKAEADVAERKKSAAKAKGKGKDALRDDGPTVAEFVKAGYLASNYPPEGYAARSTPEEIAVAIDAEEPDTTKSELKKLTNDQLRDLAKAEQIDVESDDNKAGLVDKIIAGRAARA